MNSTTTSVFSTRRRRRHELVVPVGKIHERRDDAAPEPDQSILRGQDRYRRPAGTASGSTGAGQQHPESCLPPTHAPCVPSSGPYTASWPHGSRSPGTSLDPPRSPPVPAPGRAAPSSPPGSRRTAIDSAFETRYGTRTQGKIRNREVLTASPSRRHDREAGSCPPPTADSPAGDPMAFGLAERDPGL